MILTRILSNHHKIMFPSRMERRQASEKASQNDDNDNNNNSVRSTVLYINQIIALVTFCQKICLKAYCFSIRGFKVNKDNYKMIVLCTVTTGVSLNFQGEPHRIFSHKENVSLWGSCLQGKAWGPEHSIQLAFPS